MKQREKFTVHFPSIYIRGYVHSICEILSSLVMQMQCKCLLRIAVISYNKVAFSQSQSMAFFVSSISMASISCLAHGIGSVGVRMYINGMHVLCTIRTCVRGGQGEDCK